MARFTRRQLLGAGLGTAAMGLLTGCATQQQNKDWSWWPVTQQSFNILSDGFRKKASGTSLVDSVAEAEQQIMAVFKNKGLSIRKGTA
ncbi:UNVERIFIED_ORG: hypothetical protein ABIB52_001444 [Arthrobacter sp. UYCu721]